VIGLISAVTVGKFWISYFVYNQFFVKKPVPIRWSGLTSAGLSAVFAYLSSILFYIALRYFRLKQQQEQLEKRTTQAELNLLKAQVQPHFLFNTLNNIYFVAQRESPATASMVEQLSQIMRYFVDEAPKERISLQSELQFIKSYIELEKMRMRFPLEVHLRTEGSFEELQIPPMLLIPLVENVFKHGVDKRKDDNFISAVIGLHNRRLRVTVTNRLPCGEEEKNGAGTGLSNLESRLALLFKENFTLQYGPSGTIFKAYLSIPV
jgi:LytS/YehU family sensor histidine kinase